MNETSLVSEIVRGHFSAHSFLDWTAQGLKLHIIVYFSQSIFFHSKYILKSKLLIIPQ